MTGRNPIVVTLCSFIFVYILSLHPSNLAQRKENHIKKPLNAFMLYMREMRPIVQAKCNLKESVAINQILGRRWHSLSREEQAKYYDEKAREERQEHKQLYLNWNARDNYRYSQKKKKTKRDKTDDPAANIKKCRARYSLEQQNLLCKPCRRKKKCIQMYLDGATEAEIDEQLDGISQPEDDEADAAFESKGEGGSLQSRVGSRMSSERSPQSPLDDMLSIPSLASPGGPRYEEEEGGRGGGIGYKNIQNGFRPVGADPRDSKNPLSITSLTASFGTREDGGGQIPGNLW